MKIARRFTKLNQGISPGVSQGTGQSIYGSIEWSRRSSRIGNADGSTVFEMKDAEVPASWSQLATDIVVSKYFRKAGVPQVDENGEPIRDAAGCPVLGSEKSVRQVVHRLAGCWQHWGERFGYFSSRRDAEAFYDEIAWMLLNQVAAPNSPQWFNTGLHYAYGISGPAQGHWIADHATGAVGLAGDAYTHPQPHACFIQAVRDDLVGEGGIMDLWVREARLFKYGSGTGTNFSALRGEEEPLSGGGKSSGLMSFLKIGDRAAGAIKSGGTTRRAAKMVCLDIDHPDVESFINWKVREELKVAALVEGMKHLSPEQRATADRLGLTLDYDFNGEAYYTVSGQNSNNSIRITDTFMDAVAAGGEWTLIRRIDGKPAKRLAASDLWRQITEAAWHCADPGVQFDTTINAWHTCPSGGRINASNPCSEYMFLDNTACNLASINLLKFYDPATRTFDLDGYEHAIGLWTIVLEISVLMASFPSKEIAELSWKYRTLGLGYANLGALLMQAGIPYDSEEGRAVCGALTAILTGRSYATSALLAAEHGPFAGYEADREAMLRVIRNHRRAALGVPRESDDYEAVRIRPVPIDHDLFRRGSIRFGNGDQMLARAVASWDDALSFGEKFGYRNAQVTVIAPTGTIGLLMDCDTTGVEPDFALTKFKKLAGGGYFKIANQSLRPALKALGYESAQVDEILRHVMGRLSLDVPMPAPDGSTAIAGPTFRDYLLGKGFNREQLLELENRLPTFFELGFAFSAWSLPESVFRSLGIDQAAAKANPKFNGLRSLGLNRRQIETLNRLICGTQTVEGAPHLLAEHLPVFDCANRCGPTGERFIRPEGHIRMMAACQPFISGAISKTINLPNEASVDAIGECYRLSWELGLKANALYRDGCKLSQPLSTKANAESDDDADESETAPAKRGEASAEGGKPAPPVTAPFALPTPSDGAPAAATAATSISPTSSLPKDPDRVQPIPGFREAAPEPLEPLDPIDAMPVYVERIVERIIERPMRRRLPDTRESITHKFNVAGHEGYLIVGLYEDGRPGELFITMAKEGSTIGGLMDSLGTAISVALQYGVPIESLVNKFAHQRFEPMGMTTNRDIPFAKSLVDYIFRWLGMQFIDGYREANAPRRESALAASAAPAASSPAPTRLAAAREPRFSSDAAPGAHASTFAATAPTPPPTPPSTPPPTPRSTSPASSLGIAPPSETSSWQARPHVSASSSAARPPSGLSAGAAGPVVTTTATDSATSHDRKSGRGGISASAVVTSNPEARTPEIAERALASVESHVVEAIATVTTVTETDGDRNYRTTTTVAVSSLDQSNASLMGDAPACDVCGSITIRNGTCYRCLNCGNSMGCS